jgi:hypothetical protein
MPLGSEETMQCGLKIIWSKVGITAASKYIEPKKKKVYKTTRKSTVIEKKNNAQVPMSIWYQISQLPASIQNQKKKKFTRPHENQQLWRKKQCTSSYLNMASDQHMAMTKK